MKKRNVDWSTIVFVMVLLSFAAFCLAVSLTSCAIPGKDDTYRDRHPGTPVDEHPYIPGQKP